MSKIRTTVEEELKIARSRLANRKTRSMSNLRAPEKRRAAQVEVDRLVERRKREREAVRGAANVLHVMMNDQPQLRDPSDLAQALLYAGLLKVES